MPKIGPTRQKKLRTKSKFEKKKVGRDEDGMETASSGKLPSEWQLASVTIQGALIKRKQGQICPLFLNLTGI